MKTCTNPEIGQMIGLYEFDCLSSEEKEKFEAHLLECDACFQDFYEFSPTVKVMQENIVEFRKAVEPITERMREKVFSFLEDVWHFSGKIIWEKPKMAIPALAGVGIIVLMTLIFNPDFSIPLLSKMT
ncbi:MAG: zf-HC2 domain-containing protein [bacterium]